MCLLISLVQSNPQQEGTSCFKHGSAFCQFNLHLTDRLLNLNLIIGLKCFVIPYLSLSVLCLFMVFLVVVGQRNR